MPADYLSRLPGGKETIASISAFNPFQADLYNLQMQDDDLQMLETFMTKDEWPPNLPKQDRIYFKNLAKKVFQDKNKVVWVRLNDFNYPWTALYLPAWYRKEAMCRAYDGIYGGHNATHKTYLKISTSYYWPKIIQDIEKRKNFDLCCKQQKKTTNKKTPLALLPIPDHPNHRIHADLFGPMIKSGQSQKICTLHHWCIHHVSCGNCNSKQGCWNGGRRHLQRLFFKIWNFCTNTHWRWQGIHQKALDRALPTYEHQPYKNFSCASTM